MPAHLHQNLPKLQVRAFATATLYISGLVAAFAYCESVVESLLQSPDHGVWITQALNECDLHHLFGIPLRESEAALPSPDSALIQANPSLRHFAIVSTK